jgi:hypothetical protein
MDLDTVERILQWYDLTHFNLLGGEPLLYSNLDGFFKLLEKYNKSVTLISNISIDTNKFKDFLCKYGKNEKLVSSWLINTDYPQHQEQLFLTNFKELVNLVNVGVTLSTTMLPDKVKIRKSSNRLKKIVTSISTKGKVGSVRISPSEPNHIDSFNKYDFTLDAYDIYQRLQRYVPQLIVSFDCPVTACELDYELYGKRGVSISFTGNKCFRTMPFDIMPDRSAIWCSSSNFLKVDDVLKYPNIRECQKELRRQYKEYWKTNELLCDYKNCGKYGMCKGLCPAKNESLRLLLNNKE